MKHRAGRRTRHLAAVALIPSTLVFARGLEQVEATQYTRTTTHEETMSNLMLNLLDADREVHQQVRGSVASSIIASLSAEPETLEELHAALRRFRRDPGIPFPDWPAGLDETPVDAGIGFVDLAARMIVFRTNAFDICSRGVVHYHNGFRASQIPVWYQLSNDWKLSSDVTDWSCHRESRRKRRRESVPVNSREILYGESLRFVARECVAATSRVPSRFTVAFEAAASPRTAADRGPVDNLISEIHARWLMEPRDDLSGKAPRDVLLEKQDVIDFDLQSRRDQWSLQRECPPGIAEDPRAYRQAGFGTHEIVIYYDLMRHLIQDCWDHVKECAAVDAQAETERLEQVKSDWLNATSDDLLEGRKPSEVIRGERTRVPLAVSGNPAMIDCDCPLCQMMAESGPVFLHLDGCHMDDDFAFSFHLTREQWEAERLEWEAVARDWERERSARIDELMRAGSARVSGAETWARVRLPSDDARSADTSPSFMLVAIAACLAELGLDLKEARESAPLAAILNRQFGNLRNVARDGADALLRPVADRLGDALQDVADVRPDLAKKCDDLRFRLDEFTVRVTNPWK